ncbi:MAG: hypothetical protein Q8P31_01260 [Bacillota bacterium]|nr:hypothetical protein [Bacillota bacterium]
MTEEINLRGGHRTALVYLAQADALCRAVDPWIGWRPGAEPVLVSMAPGGNLLVGSPEPPPGFRPVAGGAGGAGGGNGLAAFYRPGFLDQRSLGVGVLAGRPRYSQVGGALVPAVLFSPGRDPLASFGVLARKVFQAQIALELAAGVDAAKGVADETDLEGLSGTATGESKRNAFAGMAAMLRECQESFERYPESTVHNNVLGNLEGALLYGFLQKDGFDAQVAAVTGDDATASLARTIALVRRERWAQMTQPLVAFERRMELYEGLPRFVEMLLLRAIAAGGEGLLSADFLRLTGDDVSTAAGRLSSARFGLLTQLNRRGWGAGRRRFYHSGMGLGFLLDAAVPGWRREISDEGQPLDLVLESTVTFDGGHLDEKLLELARRRYGYYERLEDERDWAEAAGEKRRELLAKVLEAEGTRITVDVSALSEKSVWYDTGAAERIGESVVVHVRPGVFTYGDGSTFVEFRGLAMIEDRRARLFHLTVPGRNLSVFGDDDRLPAHKGAEFTGGLDVELAGLRVRAQRGTVQREGGLIFISLLA